jgi:diketogulonate reductase-like aldo/keto reductase
VEFKTLGKSNEKIPVIGLGTWGIGGFSSRVSGGEEDEVRALRLGLELEMRLIDTAEVYGHGHSEEVVARAVKSGREGVFIATKVSRQHLSYQDVIKSCESSLKRLGTTYIDLYQVHWPNTSIPITETMKAMEHLAAQGKIRHIGISNFSVQQTQEAQEALSRNDIASNQVEYSLLDRSIEGDLLHYAEKQRITIIAYSPVARGQIPRGGQGERWRILNEIVSKYDKTRSQVALNWLVTKQPVIAIPKAATPEHVRENASGVGWRMNKEDYDALSNAFT